MHYLMHCPFEVFYIIRAHRLHDWNIYWENAQPLKKGEECSCNLDELVVQEVLQRDHERVELNYG